MGGLLDGGTPDAELVALLTQDADRYTWVAAAVGSNSAIGGFNGSDPAPTLEQFQQLVAEGRIHWFLGGGRMGRSMGGSDTAQQISEWVAQSSPRHLGRRDDRRRSIKPGDAHHQPWRFVQRSSVPDRAIMIARTMASWPQWVDSLTMMFIP
jgi:hypothetical protein